MKNLVVIPAYNEAETLSEALQAITNSHSCDRCDLLVIDDGSTDDSTEILKTFPNVKVVRHDKNRGYGAALINGMRASVDGGYEKVITIDCDGQHEPQMIPGMFDALVEGVDVVSGSRYLQDTPGDDHPPADRRAVNINITNRINAITGYKLTDAFCGFKCYRVSALAKLQLDEPGYAMPLQFWIQAFNFSLTVKELAAPRIYKNHDRTFGGDLDDASHRLEYYSSVISKELLRWSISSPSEPIRTT